MAIQIPNPGTGNGATGDNEFVLWSKVKDNFSDQTNAASRLVGSESGKIPLAEQVSTAACNLKALTLSDDLNNVGAGFFQADSTINSPSLPSAHRVMVVQSFKGLVDGRYGQIALSMPFSSDTIAPEMHIRGRGNTGAPVSRWARVYTDANTTKDANGFIKAASPIVKVFADKVELNGEAVDQDVTYKKNGVGDYTITTVSGLSTDGWYIELPKDMNGNPKVAVTLTEVEGVISLKSYKRIFSMETFTFEPDLDNPLDIPDSRWIDLRLNEIPVEPSEIETEV